jgi:hypothetical protein
MIKKYVSDFVIMSLVCVVLYFITNYLLQLAGFYVESLLFGFFAVFFLAGFTYNRIWNQETLSPPQNRILFVLIFFFVFVILAYTHSLFSRSTELYEYLSSEKKRGWYGIAHEIDDSLGFKPSPNGRALHVFPYGDPVPMAYDGDGFRVPVRDTNKINQPDSIGLLFLGCSFTYGDACYAESTFAHLTGSQLGLSYINAGVASYGLSHMYLLASRLIPYYRPKYVVIQYSPWLADRGTNTQAPVYFGSLPNPYFAERDGEISIEYPSYPTQVFQLDSKEVMEKYKNRFWKYFFDKELMFFIREDFRQLKLKWNLFTGKIPRPISDKQKAEEYAYGVMVKKAWESGSVPVILNLANEPNFKYNNSLFQSLGNIIIADANTELDSYLEKSPGTGYSSLYHHYYVHDGDSVVIDKHPNNLSHKIIAATISEAIIEYEKNRAVTKNP